MKTLAGDSKENFYSFKLMDVNNSLGIAIPFIQKWEGLSSSVPGSDKAYSNPSSLTPDTAIHAYPDSGGLPTIGWGTIKYQNGTAVKSGDTITKAQADAEYAADIQKTEQAIRPMVPTWLNDNQYAALISLAYNAGPGSFHYQGLIDAIDEQQDPGTIKALWQKTAITAGGKFVQGLLNRRIDESSLFTDSNPITTGYSTTYSYYLRNKSTADTLLLAGAALIMGGAIFLYIKLRNRGK